MRSNTPSAISEIPASSMMESNLPTSTTQPSAIVTAPSSAGTHQPARSGVLEYPWIIRAYLLSRSETQGVELTPFMALRGNPHDYWFLDGDFIDRGEID